jgi:hypothetical protein
MKQLEPLNTMDVFMQLSVDTVHQIRQRKLRGSFLEKREQLRE